MKILLYQNNLNSKVQLLVECESKYLFDKCENYYEELLKGQNEIVYSHNDANETNILLSHINNKIELHLIDYEFMSWQPRGMDLGNYFIETVFDNSFPYNNGVAFVSENFIKEEERMFMIEKYLENYFKKYIIKPWTINY